MSRPSAVCVGPGTLCVGPQRSLCRAPALFVSGQRSVSALFVGPRRSLCPAQPLSGPGPFCVGPQRSLAEGPTLSRSGPGALWSPLCRAPALSVSSPGAFLPITLCVGSGALCVRPSAPCVRPQIRMPPSSAHIRMPRAVVVPPSQSPSCPAQIRVVRPASPQLRAAFQPAGAFPFSSRDPKPSCLRKPKTLKVMHSMAPKGHDMHAYPNMHPRTET